MSKSALEVKGSNNRSYSFHCSPDSPLGEVHDALCTMKKQIIDEMKKFEDKQNKECKDRVCQDEQNT